MTADGFVFGTPFYTSPERLLSEPYDGRADVYSLGAMLYVMLTGKVPFRHSDGGNIAGALRCLTEEPPSLRDVNPAIPAEVEGLVLRALSRQPWERPTARGLAREFLALAAAVKGTDIVPLAGPAVADEETVSTIILDRLKEAGSATDED